jgi:hypothetical protein
MSSLADLWKELQSGAASTAGLSMRMLLSEKDVRVFAAVSRPENCEALVIELPMTYRPKDLARISTKTFEAVLADFSGLSSGRCAISVLLRDPDYVDLFAILGNEIVAALKKSLSTPDACRAVVKCIERWRRFIEKNRRALTDEEVRGLIGELVVLCRAVTRYGSLIAVQSWQGPNGSLKDFELPNLTVEVKTYQLDTGAVVRINDPQQLEGAADRPTYLGVVRLARAQTQGHTLPEFIAFSENLLLNDLEAIEAFRDRLASAGYLPSQNDLFRDRYSAAAPQIYLVAEGFPRIKPDQVPGSVRDVHFSIILAGVASFEVDANGLLGSSTGTEGA